MPKELDPRRSSNRVIACALLLKEQSAAPIVLVSQDTNIRIKANALGMDAISYEGNGEISTDEIYSGIIERGMSGKELDGYRRQNSLKEKGDFYPNQGLVLQNRDDINDFLVYRFMSKAQEFRLVPSYQEGIW